MINKILVLLAFVSSFTGNAYTQASAPVYDTLEVGGIKQVVSYNGSATSPLILFLHGGPGSSRMRQAEVSSNQLEKHFLVVQWDQRETGRTLAINKSSQPITLERMEADAYEMIQALLKKFNAKKLYLVGESWGTVPGFLMAEKHPELLFAYIAFSPVVDQQKSEKLLIDELKKHTAGNPIAQHELNAIKIPFENGDQVYYSRKWLFSYNGQPFPDNDTAAIRQYLKDWSDTWLATWNKAVERNLFKAVRKISCPVYFFIGGKDLQTNHKLAKEYYEKLKAKKKKFYFFEDAGHSVLIEKAEEVQRIIIQEILSKK